MNDKNFIKEIAFNANQYSKERQYWVEKLSDHTGRNSIPYDSDKIEEREVSKQVECVEFHLSNWSVEKLLLTVNNSDLRLFVIFFAGLTVLLNKHTDELDILVGTSIENQETSGNFLNTILPIRAHLSREMTFKELILHIRQILIEAIDHQNFPVEQLPVELNITAETDDAFPLFDTAILLENIHNKSYIAHIPLNMVLLFKRTDDNIVCTIEYNTRRYQVETVRRIAGQFVHLIETAISNFDIPILGIDIMSESEKSLLLTRINDTKCDYPQIMVHEWFEMQVEKKPDCVAVEEVDTGRTFTYYELNRRANRLANMLIEKNTKRGDIVAVMGERTGDIVTSTLAILKAGGTFLPLDAQNPDERLLYILQDSGCTLFISQKDVLIKRESLFKALPSDNIIEMDDECIYETHEGIIEENPRITPPPENLENAAYIIYTSGTTGKPKGVIIEHRSFTNYIHFAVKNYVRNENINFPLYTSIAFDLTVTSIFTPLVTGNTVVVYSGWNKGNLIERMVDDNKVGAVKLTPSHLYLINAKKLEDSTVGVRRFIVGGETLKYQITRNISDNFKGKVEIFNEYGPTESTVGCMLYKFDPIKDAPGGISVSIGLPADNTQIYILNKSLTLVPIGAVGEIYIGGKGLSRGYLNKPELTSERFIYLSVSSGTPPVRLYKTGDLARYLQDGNIQFLGRIDTQVKIRGFRIELGEIESQLLSYDEIKEAVVTIREIFRGNNRGYDSEDKYICAYYVADNDINIPILRDYLYEKLPDYMIPSYFVRLESIPLTTNGKVNIKVLPEPHVGMEVKYIAPRNKTEKKLITIWSEILGVEEEIIGIDSDFFELGGHSLSGTVLNAKIHKTFNVKLALVDLFRLPTVRELAQLIEQSIKVEFISIEPVEEKEYYALSLSQKRIYTALQLESNSLSYNIAIILRLVGELSLENLENAFQGLIQRCESLRTSFEVIGNNPVQRIHDTVEFSCEYCDSAGGVKELRRHIRPFDLTKAPLIRVMIMKMGDNDYAMMIDISHLIADGISMNVLAKELMMLYNKSELMPLNIQYKDFSEWENSSWGAEVMNRQEKYWMDIFKDGVPELNLPTDFPRPEVRSVDAGDMVSITLEERVSGKLYQVIKETGNTLFTFLLATYYVLLNKYTGQNDIVVGTVVSGRTHIDLQNVLGVFINMLALRNFPQSDKRFIDFLEEVKVNTLDAFENQNYPAEELVKKLGIKGKLGRHPLFDTEFAVNNTEGETIEIPGLKLQQYGSGVDFAKFDFHFYAMEFNQLIHIMLRYSTELFKKETAETILGDLVEMVGQVVENVELKIEDVNPTVKLLTAELINLDKEEGGFEL